MVVSVRSLLFDKGEYIMKLSQKKWKSLISGVLLAASASSAIWSFPHITAVTSHFSRNILFLGI